MGLVPESAMALKAPRVTVIMLQQRAHARCDFGLTPRANLERYAPRFGGRLRIIAQENAGQTARSSIPTIFKSLGAEGIDVTPGENSMVGDRPEAFAASGLELIQNMGQRQNIARLGRRLIQEQYSDRTIAAAVNDAI